MVHYPRHLLPRLEMALQDTPVVFVNGPRQCGKTTLVKAYGEKRPYFTLDDVLVQNAVRSDPVGFIRRLDTAIIDEVQRVPELLRAIKVAVDHDRRPGRFLLTGSANLLTLPKIADSLAGRMEILTLLPLSHAEIELKTPSFLHAAQTQEWTAKPLSPQPELIDQLLAGGYPEMRERRSPQRRTAWAQAYLRALIEYDVHDVADIARLDEMPRLLTLLAQLSGQLVNFSEIGGQLHLDGKTVGKYIGILENLFLVKRLLPWGTHELGRLVKTPKLHFLDAGLQSNLARLTPERFFVDRARYGATLETWVYGELAKAIAVSPDPWGWQLFHYRDKDKTEVDFVLERSDRQIIGVEVKAAATVSDADFKGLKKLRTLAKNNWLSGIVLYDGSHALPFGEGFWAIPLLML